MVVGEGGVGGVVGWGGGGVCRETAEKTLGFLVAEMAPGHGIY